MTEVQSKVIDIDKTAKCHIHSGYIGCKTYTIQAEGRRLSVSRFEEEIAWQEALDRLTGLQPMLGELK